MGLDPLGREWRKLRTLYPEVMARLVAAAQSAGATRWLDTATFRARWQMAPGSAARPARPGEGALAVGPGGAGRPRAADSGPTRPRPATLEARSSPTRRRRWAAPSRPGSATPTRC